MNNRSALRLALLLLGLALLLTMVGCVPKALPTSTAPLAPPTQAVLLGPEPPPTKTAAAAPTAADTKSAAKPVPPKVGDQAYLFSLDDLSGNSVALESFRGKYLMLNFWASWCGPCRIEIPHMVKLYDELSEQGFEILAVNLREDLPKVEAFVEEMEMQFPIVMDQTGAVGNAYFVRGIPTSVFIDPQGVIQIVHTGTLTDAQLRQYVAQLMP